MYGAADSRQAPVRRGVQLALAFAVIAAALVVMVALISHAKVNGLMQTKLADAGNEYMVASALMKHAADKAFDENPPVPQNIADLAKEAETEMKIDADVMKTGKIP